MVLFYLKKKAYHIGNTKIQQAVLYTQKKMCILYTTTDNVQDAHYNLHSVCQLCKCLSAK